MVQRQSSGGAGGEAAVVLAALAFAGLMFVVGIVVGRATKHTGGAGRTAAPAASSAAETTTSATTTGTTTAGTTTGGMTSTAAPANAAGKKVFTANCAGCHTLADAGTNGNVGPNLDQAHPPRQLVLNRVTNGKDGMPSFKGQLSPTEIQAVAQYVSQAAGG